MKTYNVEIRRVGIYLYKGIKAEDEEAAIEKCVVNAYLDTPDDAYCEFSEAYEIEAGESEDAP